MLQLMMLLSMLCASLLVQLGAGQAALNASISLRASCQRQEPAAVLHTAFTE